MASVREFLRDLVAKPGELGVLRDAIAALPAKPSARPEMADEQRQAHGLELARRYDDFIKGREARKLAIEAASAKRAALDAELQKLNEEESSAASEYTGWRDGLTALLWQTRPALADELVNEADGEARSLRVDSYTLPPNVPVVHPYRGAGEIVTPNSGLADMPRVVTNSKSVEARRRGLFALAESVREASHKGATAAELREAFDRGYSALPAIEPLHAVLRQDVRGVKLFRALQPPAA